MRRALLAAVLVLAGLLVAPAPARAASGYVHIDVRAHSTWSAPLRTARSFVDRYTGTTLVFAPCVAGRKCVIVREQLVRYDWYAVTRDAQGWYSTGDRVWILLNPYRRWRPDAEQANVVAHELAHAMGVVWHSAYCTNLMYGGLRCPSGSLPPWVFLWDQRRRLALN